MKELKYEYEKKWREDQCSLFRFCGDFPVLVELDATEVDAVGWLLEDGARDACGVLGYAVLLCDESSVSDTVTSTSMGGSFGRIAGLVEGEALDAELSSSDILISRCPHYNDQPGDVAWILKVQDSISQH